MAPSTQHVSDGRLWSLRQLPSSVPTSEAGITAYRDRTASSWFSIFLHHKCVTFCHPRVRRVHPDVLYCCHFSPLFSQPLCPFYLSSQAEAAEVTHRRALKAALNSCVRLCVVAPTVNINLDGRRRSFCSGLPEEKIRTFVEGSVLPRFTRVLMQPGSSPKVANGSPRCQREDKVATDGPATEHHVDLECEEGRGIGGGGGDGDGGGGDEHDNDGQADFDKWLRDLLVDMQTSIERHVASVFQTQTVAVSASAVRR